MIEKLTELIKKAGQNIDVVFDGVQFEHPDSFEFGDYSTNVALIYAKKLAQNPRELANRIVNEITQNLPEEIEKVEVAGVGFINFFFSRNFFSQKVKEILTTDNFGKGALLQGKTYLFEYTDPNPFKAFHIGHLMANAVGETLSRLAAFQGAEVKRICYQGDIGLHVAKTIWAMRQARIAFPHDEDSIDDKIKFMGDAYVVGVNAYEDDEAAREEIKEINKKLFEKSDLDLQVYYDKGREWSLLYFDKIYKKLGTRFDDFIFESEVSPKAVEIVKSHQDVFTQSDGATVFKGEDFGLHTRVFLNSQGLPTYEAKELANAFEKASRFKFDASVITSANEINDYFKVIFKALELIDKESASKTKFVGHGMLRFKEGKMSSRKGNIITGESLIHETTDAILSKMEGRDIEEEKKADIANTIAIGAIKYTILRQSIGKDIIFDREKAISFEGDSGPYLQYAFVRIQSLLKKANEANISYGFERVPETLFEIERILYIFPEIAKEAFLENAPHKLLEYLTELTGAFSSFYASEAIVTDNTFGPYKLSISKATSKVLEQGLSLLGIAVVYEM